MKIKWRTRRIDYSGAVEGGREEFETYNRSREPYKCDVCKRAWQFTEGYYSWEYLPDFPKIGCTVNTCKRCR